MSFEPFGYRFEITSSDSLPEVKTAIRSRKKGWFDPKNGVRGWIIGPFICLWFSAFDQYGPMLFGIISGDATKTYVRGRAGSDMNGVAMFSLLLPLMIFLFFVMFLDGTASFLQLAVIGAIILIGGPMVYWSAHKDRRAAEPLIRFLRDAVTDSGRKLRQQSTEAKIFDGLTLIAGDQKHIGQVSPDMIHAALIAVGADNFVILDTGPETYMQTAFRDGRYFIEMRDGNKLSHFRALRHHDNHAFSKTDDDLFDFEEVREAFMAYAAKGPTPHFIRWEIMHLND